MHTNESVPLRHSSRNAHTWIQRKYKPQVLCPRAVSLTPEHGSHPFPNLVILQNGRLIFMLRKRLTVVGLLKEKNTYKIDEIEKVKI